MNSVKAREVVSRFADPKVKSKASHGPAFKNAEHLSCTYVSMDVHFMHF